MQELSNAELVFRWSFEFEEYIKSRAFIAMIMQILAGIAAAITIFGGILSTFGPVVAVILVGVSAVLTAMADSKRVVARRSRRIALRALAFEQDIPDHLVAEIQLSRIHDSCSPIADSPALSLHAYYAPSCESGLPRLAELYAHSVFYSAALAKRLGSIMVLPAISAFLVGILAFYALAAYPPSDEKFRLVVLNLVSTLVLLQIALRAGTAAVRGYSASARHSKVLQCLVDVADQTMLEDLAVCYELQRMRDPLIPTRLYQRYNERLANDWMHLKSSYCGNFPSGPIKSK